MKHHAKASPAKRRAMQLTARVCGARQRYESVIATLVHHRHKDLLIDGVFEAPLTRALIGLWADTTVDNPHIETVAPSPANFFKWCRRHPQAVSDAIRVSQTKAPLSPHTEGR